MLFTLVAVVLLLLGFIGLAAPVIPGLPLMWAGALAYGIGAGFEEGGAVAFGVITVAAAAGIVAGYVLPQRRATAAGATRSSLIVGVVAGIAGFFLLPPIGFLIGLAGGVLAAEQRRTGDWSVTRRTARELLIGFGLGKLAEVGAGLVIALTATYWFLFL